jgi:hypothetical protein
MGVVLALKDAVDGLLDDVVDVVGDEHRLRMEDGMDFG